MKKFTALLLAVVLLFSVCPVAHAAETVRTSQALSVNGRNVSCDIYNIDGSNYFKLRDLAYLLNGTGSQFAVGYNETARTITVTTGVAYTPLGNELLIGEDLSATAQASTQPLYIDGELFSSLSAYNIGGNNFFKLRDLGAALGFSVDYDSATRTMLVKSVGTLPQQVLTAEEIYSKCVTAVFLVEVYNNAGLFATGSGFFIDANGTAVTNYHVIEGATRAEITVNTSAGAKKYSVLGVYDYNETEDWAILKVDGSGFSYLNFGDPSSIMGGATVYAMGSPLGLDSTFSQGLISNPSRIVDGQNYIQTTAAISHGSSGGALINKFGAVIGITSASFTEGQNLNLAIPVSKLPAVSTDTYVSLDQVTIKPSGTLYADQYYVPVLPDTYDYITITALDYDCDEDTWVRFDIEDTTLIDCEWGDWDGNSIPLYIYAGSSYGITNVNITYRTDSGLVLATDFITVEVCGGYIAPDDYMDYEVYLMPGERYGVQLMAYTFDTYQTYYIHAEAEDDTVVQVTSFSEWDGKYITMYLTGLKPGETYVDIELRDYLTDEVLTSDYLYVYVAN